MLGLKRKRNLEPAATVRQYRLPEILDVLCDPGEAAVVERFLRGDAELFEAKTEALSSSRVDVTRSDEAARTIVVVANRRDNTGRSTTQGMEAIATAWVNANGVDPAKHALIWFEYSAPSLPAPIAGLWQWSMQWDALPDKYQRGGYNYPHYKPGSGHWTHLRTPKVPLAAMLGHSDEIAKPDYADNLCEIVEYMADVAMGARRFSSYNRDYAHMGCSVLAAGPADDLYALTDHVHNLGDLAQAMRAGDPWAIISACVDQLDRAVRIPAKQWPRLFDEILHEGTTPRLAEIIVRIAGKAHAHIDALETVVLEADPSLRLTSPREYQ